MAHNFKKLQNSSRMFELLLLIILFTCLYTPASSYAQSATEDPDTTGSFEFDGYTRVYEVYLPQNFQSNMPMVIALHGISETIEWFKDYTLLHEAADTSGFIVVYPQGLGWAPYFAPSWNVGPDSIDSRRNFPKTDDVGFLSALIDTMYADYAIDLARVYCCGFSTGGEMTFRMAGECGQRLAAVASVAGSLFDAAYEWPMFRSMPVLQMHGTGWESWYPYYEGFEGIWPVPDLIDFWLNILECSAQTDTIDFPDIVGADNSQVKKITWADCAGDNEFVHYKIIDGGHAWPGSTPITWSGEGNKNMDINAGVEILNFFKKFTNPLAYAAFGKSVELSPAYISASGDNLKLTAEVSNPAQHPAVVYGMIYNTEGTCLDSVQLFDDGLHNDGEASDNFWAGSKMITPGLKDIFQVGLRTRDLQEETRHDLLRQYSQSYFTTIGPVVVEDYVITSNDTIPNPDDIIRFKLKLRNNDLTATAFNIKALISTSDSCISEISANRANYGDIPAGESVIPASDFQYYSVKINPNCTVNSNVWFNVNIFSDNIDFWSDNFAFSIYITAIPDEKNFLPDKYALHQNYPNPFNPATTIKYSIPAYSIQHTVNSLQSSVGSQQNTEDGIQNSENRIKNQSFNQPNIQSRNSGLLSVELVVYDILGKEVATLVNEQQRPGQYEVKWDAEGYTSGIYFYTLTAGSYSEAKKMILLR